MAVVRTVNDEREARRLRELRVHFRLRRAARAHASAMVDQRRFAHVDELGRDLVDRLRAAGWLPRRRAWRAGEALGWGTGRLSCPRAIVEAWLESPSHRAIVLGDYAEIGVGAVIGAPEPAEPDAITYALAAGARGG